MTDYIARPATEVLKILSSLAVKEILELYHLKDSIEQLKSTVPKIQELLNLLEENHLKYWLPAAESARYDVEDLISSWEAEYHLWEVKSKVRKRITPFGSSNLLSKHRTSAELKRIHVTVANIISEGRENTRTTQASSSNNGSETINKRETGSQPPVIMVGRDDEKNKMIDLLKDEISSGGNFSVIPVVGSGGVGKTFLAQLVYKHFNETREHFDVRTWVWVTQLFDINKIFMTIIMSDIEEQKRGGNFNPDIFGLNSATVDILRNRVIKILNGKKFLIILDDIWEYDHLDMQTLVDVLSVGAKGSKVLVTSRSTEISSLMYSRSTTLLQCLDGDQSWSLFKQIAFKQGSEATQLADPEFEKYGREIVSRCQGLPLALKTVGALLCGKEKFTWQKIAQSSTWEEKDVKVLPALRLSYNNLPSRAHKKCFAYCALFPKGYPFQKDEMVKLWMAEGYVPPHPEQKPEDIGAEHFDFLEQRTLLQRSLQDEGKHTMHDLIHDLAQTVSDPFCCRVEKFEKNKSSFKPTENTRHVSLLAEQVEQPTLDIIQNSKRLHTLLFPVRRHRAYGTSQLILPFEDLGRFGNTQRQVFQSLLYMHVLDMSFSALESLPDSIGEMKLLRYLDFTKTELKELPESICNLYHLQTLKLLGCPYIFSLPKNFHLLVKLRHLELDDIFWFKIKAIPQSIGCLTNLHNLHKFQVGSSTGYKLEELKDMKHLTGKLHISTLENAVNAGTPKKTTGKANLPLKTEANLEGKDMITKMVYEWSNSDVNVQDDALEKQVLEELKPPSKITELRISHYRGTEFPSWMGNGYLNQVVTIVLNDCNRIKTLSLGKLPNLEELHLKNMQKLEEWNEEEYESFNLEKIKEKHYQPLRKVTICNCPNLIKTPSCFSKLGALKIIKCKQLQKVPLGEIQFITLEDNDALKHWGGEESLQIISPTQDLGEEELSQIASSVRSHCSLCMINLKIVNCPALNTLPSPCAPQKLEISGCSSLSTLPEENYSQRLVLLALDSYQGDTLLGNIPRSPGLLNLMITNITGMSCLPTFPDLPMLETLHIHDCPDLEKLSTKENRLFEHLTRLETLSIKNCPKLVELPEEGLPPNRLRYLNIGPCEKLTSFGPPDVLLKLNSLQDLYLEGCRALESLPTDGLPSSLLHLSIKACPSLMKTCAVDGADWQKIKDISDLEIETQSSTSKPPWYKISKIIKKRQH